MTRVYIASPYWSDDPQIRSNNVARQITTANMLINTGFAPFWPLASYYLEQDFHRPEFIWAKLSIEWIAACDILLRLPGKSPGAEHEVVIAQSLHIPVFFDLNTLIREVKP